MQNKILVISSYPPKNTKYGKGVSGAAHYIKNLITNISDKEFLVLAQKTSANEKQYTEENVTVQPTWTQDSIFYFLELIKGILKNRKHKKAIINFEFKIFGGKSQLTSIINLLTFPLVVFTLKILSIKYLTVMHPAMLRSKELTALSEHLKKNPNNPLLKLFTLGNQMFMWFLVLLSKYTVTFENEFGKRLTNLPLIKQEQVKVIPHYIYPKSRQETEEKYSDAKNNSDYLDSKASKNELDFNLLFFGFLTPYKGIEELVNIASSKNWPKGIKLTVAGGNSPSAGNDEYYEKVVEKIKKNPNIKHTGFVPDEDIPKYFDRADLVILPYKVMIASSGPMSMAISYDKPFILSDKLKPYTETNDFSKAIEQLNLNPNKICFKLDIESLIGKLDEIQNNPGLQKKLKKISGELQRSRSLNLTSKKYQNILNNM